MSKALPPIGRRQSNSTRRSSVNKMSTYPPKEGSRRTSQARSMGNTARSVSPTATQVPSLPPVDFNLGPMQERVLPSYNDLEDPHLNLYWRRQQYLVYEREEKKRQQRKLEEREARQQEAARRRFKERRQQELLGLSQKKGRPCSSCRNGTHTEASHQPAKPKRKSSTKPANKRPNTYKRPSDAAKAVSPKKEEEPPLSETDSTVGDDIWADRERYLGEEINGISIHYLPLDDNKAFLELEEERRRLRALDKVSYAGVIDDLEKRMKEIATALAEKEKKTAERKLYLDPFPEGILLEEVPLDDDEAFTKMEAERAELLKDGKDTKEIEQKLNDRCHEIAYDMKWKDREGYLGTSLENVAVRELPLDKNSGFLRVEEERKDLLKEEKSPAGDKIISEMENRLKQLATEEAKKKSDQWRELDVEKEESLRRLSAHEEEEQKRLAAEYAKSPNKSDQWRELDTEKEESLRRLSAHEEEEQKRLAAEYAKSPKRTLLSRESIATSYGEDSDDSEEEWRELDEKPAKPLSAHFEKKPEVKDEYDDDDFEVEENTKPAAKDEDEWREIDDEDEDEKAKSPVKPLHSTEEKKVEKDEYDDDDFEDELDVTPKKDASRDLPKADEWKELDEEDVKPLTANFEKAPKKLSAHFEKKPVQPIVATEEKVNDWREISEDDIDEDEKAKTPVKPLHSTEEKKVEKDEYDDDDFEDELDVTPKKEANASRDLPKADEWKELDEEDVKPLTANFEKAPKEALRSL
ncbi:hypothetical protein ADEAN_000485400 [Angomonas deanei]|uniref:DUF7623 domain-containing protein n=1 Tax=Angomonas deanei TaxID=59799 RepID=A0A7G2CC37_9TRYP|nr:hypothetical protein ADEAN_000485400 [Angomonas deanei]